MMHTRLFERKRLVGLLMLIGSLITLSVITIWVVFNYQKYWPTPHQAELVQQLNADLHTGSDPTEQNHRIIDKVNVHKSKRYLELLSHGQVMQRYPIRLGFAPTGHKLTEGDGKTPEGIYTLDWRNPNSQFYRSLHVSYPNQQDQANATMQGVKAGSNIMIHGSFPVRGKWLESGKPFYQYMPQQDWTLGCIAVTNAAMDDIWARVKNGTPIEIMP